MRLRQIADVERAWAENGMVIRKFFLHISPGEQTERFRKRLENPEKQWKVEESDFEDRKRRSGDVQSTYVMPRKRGHGIGGALVRSLCEEADRRAARAQPHLPADGTRLSSGISHDGLPSLRTMRTTWSARATEMPGTRVTTISRSRSTSG